MAIKHGVYVYEEDTALQVPQEASASTQVIIGTAPVNMVDDPSAVVNKPVLANSATEAMKLLGYSDNFSKYSLCQSMYLASNLSPVGPMVFINVLDPATHKKALSSASYQVNQKQAVVNVEGVIRDGLVVTTTVDNETATLTKNTDYVLSYDDNGYLVITLLASSDYAAATALTVSGYQIDVSGISASTIVGGVNPSTGAETGIEVVRQVFPKLGIVPGLILAPGWSQNSTVGLALIAKASLLNGVFRSMALVDLDTSSCTKYQDVKTAKENAGYTSPHSYVLWPCDKIGDKIFAKSAVVGCCVQFYDTANGDIPYRSPSNNMIGITGQCLADGTEVVLDQDQANTVNGFGVTTAINVNGWRIWGNYTGAYPGSGDAKDIWFPVRRMFNWQGNTFILTYFARVDDPMNRRLIDAIVDSENIRCGALAPEVWAGAAIHYYADDNPITDILAGKITFRQEIAPYTPAQDIENILSYDIEMLKTALGGE